MKLLSSKILSLIACLALGFAFSSCSSPSPSKEETQALPLNLSVFLDLSDRISRDNVQPSQMYNDTAIVNYLVQYFVDDCVKRQIIKSVNNFQVLFYPSPDKSDIRMLSKTMCADLSKMKISEKSKVLKSLSENVNKNLALIYDETLKTKSFPGCDIWSFISNKKIDQYCIRPGYRNVLVILTDGYLFHNANKLKEGDAYSYILPQTLAVEGSSLIVKRNDLSDIEILMLEVNPYEPKQRDRLIETLEEWFMAMGLPHNNFVINETDVENRTEVIIDNFLNRTI